MNPLTEDRHAVALELAAVLGWPVVGLGDDPPPDATGTVYRDPPAGITVPCAIVAPDGGPIEMVAHGPTYSAPLTVWIFADGLNLEALEDILWTLLAAIPAENVNAPGRIEWGGTSYLGSSFTLERHVYAAPTTP